MGLPAEEARGALRLSLGRTTTDAEVEPRRRPSCATSSSASASAVATRMGHRRLAGRGVAAGRVGGSGGVSERVLVAMSGGVDSSVAAALVARSGAEAVGVWMRLHDGADSFSDVRRSCCSADAADDARRVAGQLGIPFYILDLEREFEAGVMRPFVDGVPRGTDAQPLHRLQHAPSSSGRSWGVPGRCTACDAVATGHYARVRRGGRTRRAPGGMRHDLLTGVDRDKDQSYFLYGLGQDQLAHSRFPLGRADQAPGAGHRPELGLVTAAKPESQELCFVPGGDIGEALRDRASWQPVAGSGASTPTAGRSAGHRGPPRSRSDSVRASAWPWASASTSRRVDVAANVIQLGRRADLERSIVRARRAVHGRWPASRGPDSGHSVRIRHRGELVPGRVEPPETGDGRALVPNGIPSAGG